jgi:predicted amidohydrolase
MPVRAAIAQIATIPADPQSNLSKILAYMEEAARAGAQLVVFPECATTGYALTPQELETLAGPIPGPLTQPLQRACQQHGCYAVVGTLEKDRLGRIYNSAALLGPEGLLATYRKTHLPLLGLDRYVKAGARLLPPVHTPVGRLGLLICYDLRFPEPARALALRGAEVVLLPTAWPAAASLYPDFMAQSRAAENRITLLAANHVGEERGTQYLGRSLAVDPAGRILAQASQEQEELLLVDVDPQASRVKDLIFTAGEYELHLFKDRRPELYRPLCAPTKGRKASGKERPD